MPSEETSFVGVKKFFSGSPSTASSGLPFSYADAAHTKPASAPKTASTSWLSAWGSPISTSADTSKASDSWWETMGLTRMQRYSGFAICLVAACFLFLLAFLHLPMIVIRPRKFVVPYCFGSLLVALSFAFLHGFVSYFSHLVTSERRWMSAAFYGSTLATLYVAMSLQSYVLTGVFSVVQAVTMVAYVVSYVPGGRAGISAMTTMATGTIMSSF